jgi:hypothetical protein
VLDKVHELLDQLFAAVVPWMALAGENKLDRAFRVEKNALETISVAQQKRGPLIGGESPCKPDREYARIENGLDSPDFRP